MYGPFLNAGPILTAQENLESTPVVNTPIDRDRPHKLTAGSARPPRTGGLFRLKVVYWGDSPSGVERLFSICAVMHNQHFRQYLTNQGLAFGGLSASAV